MLLNTRTIVGTVALPKGVFYDKSRDKYVAWLKRGGKTIWRHRFDTCEAAITARREQEHLHPVPPPKRTQIGQLSPEDRDWAAQFCWRILKNGYIVRNVKLDLNRWSPSYLHREIAERMGLDLSGEKFVDHINRNKLDNRRENLRTATATESTYNKGPSAGTHRSNKLGVVGVYFDQSRGKFKASLSKGRRTIWQQRFDTLDEAITARHEQEQNHFGAFAPCC